MSEPSDPADSPPAAPSPTGDQAGEHLPQDGQQSRRGQELQPHQQPQVSSPGASPAGTSPARSGLPFGPIGMLAVTAVALIVAGLVAWGATALLSSGKKSNAVDITEALDDVTYTPYDGSSKMVKVGDRAPDIPLDLIKGEKTTLSKAVGDGRPVLLNFWSSTCAPCLKEMPALESVHNDVGDQVLFLGINAQDSLESAEKMIDRTGVTFDSARDPRGEISTQFAAHALPRTVLIDAKGKVVAVHSGALTREKLVDMLGENGFPVP